MYIALQCTSACLSFYEPSAYTVILISRTLFSEYHELFQFSIDTNSYRRLQSELLYIFICTLMCICTIMCVCIYVVISKCHELPEMPTN